MVLATANAVAMGAEITRVIVKRTLVRVVTAVTVATTEIAVVKDVTGTKVPAQTDAMRAAAMGVHAVIARAVAEVVASAAAVAVASVVRVVRTRVPVVTRMVAARDPASNAAVAAAAKDPAVREAVKDRASAVARDPAAAAAMNRQAALIATMAHAPKARALDGASQAPGAAKLAAAKAAASKRHALTRAAASTRAVTIGAVISIQANAVISRGLMRASRLTILATASKAPMQTETARAVNVRSAVASVAAVEADGVADAAAAAAERVAAATAAEQPLKAAAQKTLQPCRTAMAAISKVPSPAAMLVLVAAKVVTNNRAANCRAVQRNLPSSGRRLLRHNM